MAEPGGHCSVMAATAADGVTAPTPGQGLQQRGEGSPRLGAAAQAELQSVPSVTAMFSGTALTPHTTLPAHCDKRPRHMEMVAERPLGEGEPVSPGSVTALGCWCLSCPLAVTFQSPSLCSSCHSWACHCPVSCHPLGISHPVSPPVSPWACGISPKSPGPITTWCPATPQAVTSHCPLLSAPARARQLGGDAAGIYKDCCSLAGLIGSCPSKSISVKVQVNI